MEYITRNLESNPGLGQTEALIGLQTHPTWKQGSMVKSLRKRGNVWVAEVLEPKESAEDPPDKDGGDEGGASDEAPPKAPAPPSDPDGDGDNDSSPSGDTDKDFAGAPGGEKPGGDKPESKGNVEEQILHTLQQLLHAVQGGGAPEGLGGPDALGPDPLGGTGGPPPPKGGPPAGGPPAPAKGAPGKMPPRAMKPGDTPPGGTPVGAPAFASTHQSGPVAPAQGTPVPTGQQPGPVGQQGTGGVCPMDGNPEPCPIHSGQGGLNQMVASYSGRASTITLTTTGSDLKQAVSEARPVVENYGYQVKQAKYGENGQIHILASRR